MAKRQKKIIQPIQPASEETAEEPKIGYTVGNWAGHAQYRCKECSFDTLSLDIMLEHLLRVHSVIALKEPEPFPPSQPAAEEQLDVEKADGIYEIDLKEDQ